MAASRHTRIPAAKRLARLERGLAFIVPVEVAKRGLDARGVGPSGLGHVSGWRLCCRPAAQWLRARTTAWE